MAVRLAHAFDTSAEMWLGLQNQLDLFEVRRKLAGTLESMPVLRQGDSTSGPGARPGREEMSALSLKFPGSAIEHPGI